MWISSVDINGVKVCFNTKHVQYMYECSDNGLAILVIDKYELKLKCQYDKLKTIMFDNKEENTNGP